MTELLRMYPERENDIVAIIANQHTSEAGAVNWMYPIMRLGNDITTNGTAVIHKGRHAIKDAVDWCVEEEWIEQKFLDDLGRVDSPLWGNSHWNEIMVPDGYIDRVDLTIDTIMVTLGGYIVSKIFGPKSLAGLMKITSNQYSKYKTRKWKSELDETLETLVAQDDGLPAFIAKDIDETNLLTSAIAEMFSSNNIEPVRTTQRNILQS